MTLINLKFSPEMEELILQGKKCCTTRDEIKAESGDVFRVRNRLYRIVGIQIDDYEFIDRYYNLDGFNSVDEYLDTIDKIYPEINPEGDMFIHFFAYVCDVCRLFNTGFCWPDGKNCQASEICNKDCE